MDGQIIQIGRTLSLFQQLAVPQDATFSDTFRNMHGTLVTIDVRAHPTRWASDLTLYVLPDRTVQKCCPTARGLGPGVFGYCYA